MRTAGRIAALDKKTIDVKPYVSNDLGDIVYLPADDEEEHYIAQANSAINSAGEFLEDRVEVMNIKIMFLVV